MIPWEDYDLVLFDFDDTLVDFEVSEQAAVAAICALHNVEYNVDVYRTFRKINRKLWGLHDIGTLTLTELFRVRFDDFFGFLGLDGDVEEANVVFLNALADEVQPYPGAIELLSHLAKIVTIGIVSNGHGPTQRLRAQRAGFSDLIHFVVISGEVGAGKPSQIIFDAALKSAQTLRGDKGDDKDFLKVLMIGDNLVADIEGGFRAGFDTCWLNHGKAAAVVVRPTYEFESFAHLMALTMKRPVDAKAPTLFQASEL